MTTCFSCGARFWMRPDTLTVAVSHLDGANEREGIASFCEECTARIDAALAENADA